MDGNPSQHCLVWVSNPCMVLSQCSDVSVCCSALVMLGSHLHMEVRAVERALEGHLDQEW